MGCFFIIFVNFIFYFRITLYNQQIKITTMNITLTAEFFSLKENTKNTFVSTGKESKSITWDEYKKHTDINNTKFFRNLGGSERVTKSYTSQGYIITKIISLSPEKKHKLIRTFKFD